MKGEKNERIYKWINAADSSKKTEKQFSVIGGRDSELSKRRRTIKDLDTAQTPAERKMAKLRHKIMSNEAA